MLLRPIQDIERAAALPSGILHHLHDALELVPKSWRDFFYQPNAYHRLEFLDAEIVVWRVVHGIATEIERIPHQAVDKDGTRPSTLSRLQWLLADDRTVAICLPQSECLHRTLEMPAASKRTLRAALAYELERISPIELEHIYFDFFVLRADRITRKIELELRIIKRTVVNRAVEYCHGAGLAVGSIGFSGERREADWMHFPVARRAMLQLFWRRWNVPLLASLALVLSLATLVAAYERGNAAESLMEDQLVREQLRALTVSHIQAEINRTRLQAEFLVKQRAAPLLVETLADLTRILPDDTWLSEIEMNGSKIRVQGYSKAASNLIGIIDRSGQFTNAQFEAPLMRGQGDASDRFDLSFDIKRSAQ
jgi:general secretion pathway protein L